MNDGTQNRRQSIYTGLLGIFIILFLLTGCSSSRKMGQKNGGLTVYYVRHAETVGNATGLKNTTNNKMFTDTGHRQVANLTESLNKISIDHVIVSPTWRTRHTVLPYLKKTNKTAEIWPELEEWRMEAQVQMGLEPLDGSPIQIEEENSKYFLFRDSNSTNRYVAGDYSGGMQQLETLVKLIESRYSGENKTLLLVGHKDMGSRIIETLMGLDPEVKYQPEFGKLNMLKQNGKNFELLVFNDQSME